MTDDEFKAELEAFNVVAKTEGMRLTARPFPLILTGHQAVALVDNSGFFWVHMLPENATRDDVRRCIRTLVAYVRQCREAGALQASS